MLTKDGKDVNVLEITADNYVVPKGEELQYHCKIEVRKFNSENGDRLSRPRIQKFGRKMYKSVMKEQLKKQGYTVTILHDPDVWLKENQEAAAEARKAAAEAATAAAAAEKVAAAEEQQKAIDEAVAAALEANAEKQQKAIDDAVAAALAKKETTSDEKTTKTTKTTKTASK